MSDPLQLRCPHCRQAYRLPAEQVGRLAGRSITCRKCGKPFQAEAALVAARPAVVSTPKSSDAPSLSPAALPPWTTRKWIAWIILPLCALTPVSMLATHWLGRSAPESAGGQTESPVDPDDTAELFRRSHDVLARLGPSDALEAADNVKDISSSSAGFVVRSVNEGPELLLPAFTAPPAGRAIVRIDVTFPVDSEAWVYWKTRTADDYTDDNKSGSQVPKGRQVAYIEIPLEDIAGRLRLDLGVDNVGEYGVHSVEIRLAPRL